MMRIDSHVHVWTMGEPPFEHNNDMSPRRPDYPGLVEDLIRYMDLNRIDRTIMIQCMYHGYDNRYMCDCIRRFPDRLHGVALIDPQKPDAPEILERLHREHGVQGMRLYPI
ncbi:MAG: amidohydrolase family protein, partial [bacterium]|nr:amidohydrolase family protein [bacterium]